MGHANPGSCGQLAGQFIAQDRSKAVTKNSHLTALTHPLPNLRQHSRNSHGYIAVRFLKKTLFPSWQLNSNNLQHAACQAIPFIEKRWACARKRKANQRNTFLMSLRRSTGSGALVRLNTLGSGIFNLE